MNRFYFVRVGVMGVVGRFQAVDAAQYDRRGRVIVRTDRGLETGEIVSVVGDHETNGDVTLPAADGTLLRRMTTADELLHARLERDRNEAFEACAVMLSDFESQATLIDVEYLFGGQGLYFYFLGDVDSVIESRVESLANQYDTVAQVRRFSETLENGCGPDCGTENADGAACGDCVSCAVADACGVRAH